MGCRHIRLFETKSEIVLIRLQRFAPEFILKIILPPLLLRNEDKEGTLSAETWKVIQTVAKVAVT